MTSSEVVGLAFGALAACSDRVEDLLTPEPAGSAIGTTAVRAPEVEIRAPDDGDVVSGTVVIEGRTRERDNDLLKTDLYIGIDLSGDGDPVMSTTQEGDWSYEWDTDGLYGGDYYIMAVATDVEGWSTSSSITLTVSGPEPPAPPALVYIALEIGIPSSASSSGP